MNILRFWSKIWPVIIDGLTLKIDFKNSINTMQHNLL